MGKKEEQDTAMEVVDAADDPMEEDSNNNDKWKYREYPSFQETYLKIMKIIEEEDRIEDEENAAAAEAAKPGRKRAHAPKAGELNDVETTKRYKCNYWADPASAMWLDLGHRLSRSAAVKNHSDWNMAAIMAHHGLPYVTPE